MSKARARAVAHPPTRPTATADASSSQQSKDPRLRSHLHRNVQIRIPCLGALVEAGACSRTVRAPYSMLPAPAPCAEEQRGQNKLHRGHAHLNTVIPPCANTVIPPTASRVLALHSCHVRASSPALMWAAILMAARCTLEVCRSSARRSFVVRNRQP